MNWFQRMFESLFGWKISKAVDTPQENTKSQRLQCIRFITERGEQLAVLLTTEEFESGIRRWVETIDTMPIDTVDPEKDERIP